MDRFKSGERLMEQLSIVVGWCRFWVARLLVILCVGVCFAGCRDVPAAEMPAPPPLTVRAHLPGTVLRDVRGTYWMVVAWPERARIPSDERHRARLQTDHAPVMTSLEEMCLRDRGTPWRADVMWELMRLPNGERAYLDRARHLRRSAESWTIQARNDDASAAPLWSGTMEEMYRTYRDVGRMPLPEGALLRTERGLFFYFEGKSHPFATEALAREVGYRPERAVTLSESDRVTYGETAPPLTADVFMTCPMAAANARRNEDQDGDGDPRGQDCDDHDPVRAHHLEERCDGVDNNCDGIVDDGFMVGFPCIADDGCRSPGITACTYDRWGVRCNNDEAICE